MMKKNILKIFAVLLALLMLFVLASCGGKDKNNPETTDTSSVTETENTDNEKIEGGIETEKDNQEQKVRVGSGTDGSGKDGSAKSGGKDTGKDSGKSPGSSDTEKQTGGNSSETSKPSGATQEETTSATDPQGKR